MSSQKMKTIRILNPVNDTPYSTENRAPSSVLSLDDTLDVPRALRPDEIVVRVHAATVTRDELTWPETYK
jgi:NADPH2:quinone reductase